MSVLTEKAHKLKTQNGELRIERNGDKVSVLLKSYAGADGLISKSDFTLVTCEFDADEFGELMRRVENDP